MTRAIVMSWHKYQPWGDEFYRPLWTGFLRNLSKWHDEFDKLYIIDSNWNLTHDDIEQLRKVKKDFHIHIGNPHQRYYDAYKDQLSKISEDAVMLMDNDMVVYRTGNVAWAFENLASFDVCSIYDTIGDYKTDKLNGKNKFCPYWFATRTELLKKYLDTEWGPDMPYCETLGHLTKKMLLDNVRPFEFEEDKSGIHIDGSKTDDRGKNLGYYHIRAGSVPAYLLSEKTHGNKQTYHDYLRNQPKNEYLRQCAWYQYLGGDPSQIVEDAGVFKDEWYKYYSNFVAYHGIQYE